MSSQHPDDSLLKEYDGKTAPAVSSILLRQMTLAITIFFESIIEHMMRKVNINESYRDLSIVLISPFASLAIVNGSDIASVSEVLGHTDKATTLRVYSHADEESKRRAAGIVAAAIKQA